MPLGLFIIRGQCATPHAYRFQVVRADARSFTGDNIAVVAVLDVEAEAKVDLSLIRGAKTLPPVVH